MEEAETREDGNEKKTDAPSSEVEEVSELFRPPKTKRGRSQSKSKKEIPDDSLLKTRSKRKICPPEKLEVTHSKNYSTWSQQEKNDLYAALKKYSIDDKSKIDECVPTKTRKQWQSYCNVMKNKYIRLYSPGQEFTAPIELWLKTASDLTAMEADYSSEISQVMSLTGWLEPHDPPRQAAPADPDWNKLYQYISALLKGESACHKNLTSIEAAVILDMLQNLSDHLNSLDTSQQRELMLRKYNQLAENFTTSYPFRNIDALRYGLDKDPLVEDIPPYQARDLSSEGDATSSSDAGGASSKKSTLFTINPFSIPVKYLKPSSKTSVAAESAVGGNVEEN